MILTANLKQKGDENVAYSGFLIKFGNYTIPNSLIRASTYKPYVNMQDIDTYPDANGYLHRNAVDLKAVKVEFELIPMLTNKQFAEFMSNIRSNYTIEKARQGTLTAYIPEYDDYVTQTAYMADFQPQIYGTYGGVIHYDAIRLAFIGGVYDG